MTYLEKTGPLFGRVLIALIFVLSGVSKITGFDGTVGYIASKNLPFPALAAVAAIVVELGGGLLLMLGWRARLSAAAMGLFTIAAAVLFHDFWAAAPDAAHNQMIHFMKNLSMAGGLLMVVVHGSGPLSVDRQD
ncbi:DoxX family protein [Undibacterium crateris]|uniref:DoxX family protein n=1 Tax=Undibacterium crateris TaxID=2528175 RepID=UPI0013894A73|nr:DoxX family protein [Undibacterium crateris]NDI85619.1 DoxX family membrane protein [Undibacterium crateris]